MEEEWRKWKDTITKPGWYWRKEFTFGAMEIDIVRVRIYNRQLCIMNSPISKKEALWAGPIPCPTEEPCQKI